MAAPGTNLLLHPEAVVRYGTPGFPKTAKAWPANRGNLFAGGAGGTAKLVQQASVTPNARYDIAGWLGGTKTSAAELTVQFTGASGRILATAAIGPAGKQAKPVLDYRRAAGTVPAGALASGAVARPRRTSTRKSTRAAPITSRSPAAARSASRSPTPKRKTRSITSAPRTSGTS
jgi:hypothetical protein